MFTGIIEALGTVKSIENQGTNQIFWIESPLSDALKIDQSLAHEGVCLTIDQLQSGAHRVTAIAETLQKTNLSHWIPGKRINLERCLSFQGRIDGHVVQGHVDGVGQVKKIETNAGSWIYEIEFDEQMAGLVIEKGSIALNGTSLTVFNVSRNRFQVAIIPYTYEHTSIQYLVVGSSVNLEFDLIGKYILRRLDLQQSSR